MENVESICCYECVYPKKMQDGSYICELTKQEVLEHDFCSKGKSIQDFQNELRLINANDILRRYCVGCTEAQFEFCKEKPMCVFPMYVHSTKTVDNICGVPLEDAIRVLEHYKRTNKELSEDYIQGFEDGMIQAGHLAKITTTNME